MGIKLHKVAINALMLLIGCYVNSCNLLKWRISVSHDRPYIGPSTRKQYVLFYVYEVSGRRNTNTLQPANGKESKRLVLRLYIPNNYITKNNINIDNR